ncbi:MAG: hypothetical protein DMF55_01635, partial [Acidobacteria bacterium]
MNASRGAADLAGQATFPATTAQRSRKRRRSALRDRAELALFRAAAGGLALLPPAAARRAGRAAARIVFSFLRSRRKILLDNL